MVRPRLLALLVLGGLAAGALLLRVGPAVLGPDCSVVVAGEQVGLSRAQARDATTLAAVTRREGLSQQVTAAALQARLDDADGRLQPDAAARLLAAAGPVASPESLSLARALLGYGEERLTCDDVPGVLRRQAEGTGGLTPRAVRVREAMTEAFGPLPLGGFAPGGVRSGHVPGSAHYEGRAVDVFFRPVTERNRQEGWTTAQWAVAHADELELAVVIFDRQLWSVARSGEGWRPYRHPSGNTTNPVLLHLDHVHLDVQRGVGT